MPRDAEAWLAERGIERDPIRVAPPPPDAPDQPDGPGARPAAGSQDSVGAPEGPTRDLAVASADDDGLDEGPSIGAREAQRLAGQALADAQLADAERHVLPDPGARRLENDVAQAVAFVRRSTSVAPQAEGRVRTKLEQRGWPGPVVEQAMERARRERLVDDAAMAGALVDERRSKGHAVGRIRRDLRERGFSDDVLDEVLADAEAEDPQAVAFALARDKAAGLTALPPDKAFRRVAAHVARRGYGEGLARKVARDAVLATRDAERTAGH